MHILYNNRALSGKSTNFAKKLLRVFLQVDETSNLPNFEMHIFKLKIMTDLWLISSIIMNYAEKNWILIWTSESWIYTYFLSHKDYPFILLERKIDFNLLKGYIPDRQPWSIIYNIWQQIFEEKYWQNLHFFKEKHGKHGNHTVTMAWIITTMPKNMTALPSSWHDRGKIIAWQPIFATRDVPCFSFLSN